MDIDFCNQKDGYFRCLYLMSEISSFQF